MNEPEEKIDEESLNLLLVAVEYYEMNHDTSDEESTERHKANVWKAYNNIREKVTGFHK